MPGMSELDKQVFEILYPDRPPGGTQPCYTTSNALALEALERYCAPGGGTPYWWQINCSPWMLEGAYEVSINDVDVCVGKHLAETICHAIVAAEKETHGIDPRGER